MRTRFYAWISAKQVGCIFVAACGHARFGSKRGICHELVGTSNRCGTVAKWYETLTIHVPQLSVYAENFLEAWLAHTGHDT